MVRVWAGPSGSATGGTRHEEGRKPGDLVRAVSEVAWEDLDLWGTSRRVGKAVLCSGVEPRKSSQMFARSKQAFVLTITCLLDAMMCWALGWAGILGMKQGPALSGGEGFLGCREEQ